MMFPALRMENVLPVFVSGGTLVNRNISSGCNGSLKRLYNKQYGDWR